MNRPRWEFIHIIAILVFFTIGLVAGTIYQKQLSETRFQEERLRMSRLRYQDWSAFFSHILEDEKHPDRKALHLTGSHNLSFPIIHSDILQMEKADVPIWVTLHKMNPSGMKKPLKTDCN